MPADDAPVLLFPPAFDEEAAHRRVPRPHPGHGRRPTAAAARRRRRFDGRHGGDRPRTRVEVRHLAGQPGPRRRRACRAAARRRARRRSVVFCDADGEYPPEEIDALVAPILAGDGRLRRRQPVPRPHRPHARPPARRQRRADRRPVVRRPAADHRRPERLPGVLTGGRRRRRGDPRLQLRPGPDAGPAGQGLPVPRGADQLPLPHDGPQLRHARPLPAATSCPPSTASSTRPDRPDGPLEPSQQPCAPVAPFAAVDPRRPRTRRRRLRRRRRRRRPRPRPERRHGRRSGRVRVGSGSGSGSATAAASVPGRRRRAPGRARTTRHRRRQRGPVDRQRADQRGRRGLPRLRDEQMATMLADDHGVHRRRAGR